MRIKSGSQKGAAMVEFALILIPLLLITFGIIEFGMYIYNKQVLTNASREGARAGIVSSNPRFPATGAVCPTDGSVQPTIECVALNYCLNHLVTFGSPNTPNITKPPTGYSTTAVFGTELTVQVNYQYSFLVIPNFIPGIATLLEQISNMHAVTVMRYE